MKKISVFLLVIISVFLMNCTESSHDVVFSADEFKWEIERLSEIYNVPVSFYEKEKVPSFANLNRIKSGMELIQKMKNGEFSVIPVSDNEINLVVFSPNNPILNPVAEPGSAIIGQSDWMWHFTLTWTELDVYYSIESPLILEREDIVCAYIHDGQVELDTSFDVWLVALDDVFLGRYKLYGNYVIATGEDNFSFCQISPLPFEEEEED